jgi:hypothetical protein
VRRAPGNRDQRVPDIANLAGKRQRRHREKDHGDRQRGDEIGDASRR